MLLRAAAADRGKRLDAFLHERLPEYSRSRLQSWIRDGRVLVNGAAGKPSAILRGAEEIDVEPAHLPPLKAEAEDIPLSVLYEDAGVVAIDKPAGMVVHAGAGVHRGTVVNALLHRFACFRRWAAICGRASCIGWTASPAACCWSRKRTRRIGISPPQFSSRKVEKIYLALVEGTLTGRGRIEKPIARDPRNRARMTARLSTRTHGADGLESARAATRGFTLLEIRIGTGRTHQIRAHMAALGHPVAGDRLYGAKPSPWNRYFLHAHRLGFRSPATGEKVAVESPLPPDLVEWERSLS